MNLRIEMMREGWASEDRLTRTGWGDKPGYSIWFRRSDWHGKRALVLTGDCAIYHAHTPVLEEAGIAVAIAAELARRAWRDFPECPPVQLMDGKLLARKPIGVT